MTTKPEPARKIFGVGMFRTGTTSLGEAMKTLGLRSRVRFVPFLQDLEDYFDLETEKFAPYEAQIRAMTDEYEFVCDAPWLYLYRELDRWYPDSLFILTLRREIETLPDSEMRHWRGRGVLSEWLKVHDAPPARRRFIDRYLRHNANVLEYFRDRPQQLLTLCLATEPDPWRRIADFVGRPAPKVPFPHVNH